MRPQPTPEPESETATETASCSWKSLLRDPAVIVTFVSIWISTSVMAILEPCLPLWLLATLSPPPTKWQLGAVFIPDSIGYLTGTNFASLIWAEDAGLRWKFSIVAMVLVGISAVALPAMGSMAQLAWPHLGIGLGIGAVDAALVPLLATIVDQRHKTSYGAVYALQQMSVSLAYSLGPFLGGEAVRGVGFPALMRTVGCLNILLSPAMVVLSRFCSEDKKDSLDPSYSITYNSINSRPQKEHYNRFYNDEE